MPNEVLLVVDILSGCIVGKYSFSTSACFSRGWGRSGTVISGSHSRGGFEFASRLVNPQTERRRSLRRWGI